MPVFLLNYNVNVFCIFVLIYKIWNSEYINIILSKLYLNYTSMLILINIVGLFLFLKNFKFEVNIKISYGNCEINY